jgi:hypothetical protein
MGGGVRDGRADWVPPAALPAGSLIINRVVDAASDAPTCMGGASRRDVLWRRRARKERPSAS